LIGDLHAPGDDTTLRLPDRRISALLRLCKRITVSSRGRLTRLQGAGIWTCLILHRAAERYVPPFLLNQESSRDTHYLTILRQKDERDWLRCCGLEAWPDGVLSGFGRHATMLWSSLVSTICSRTKIHLPASLSSIIIASTAAPLKDVRYSSKLAKQKCMASGSRLRLRLRWSIVYRCWLPHKPEHQDSRVFATAPVRGPTPWKHARFYKTIGLWRTLPREETICFFLSTS
jgi:hypothetical protein